MHVFFSLNFYISKPCLDADEIPDHKATLNHAIQSNFPQWPRYTLKYKNLPFPPYLSYNI